MKTITRIQIALVASFMSLGIVACNKGGDSGSNAAQVVTPGNGPLNCTTAGCAYNPAGSGVLISVSGTATGIYSQITVDLDLMASGGAVNLADPKAVIFYNGPIFIRGYLRISSNTGTPTSSVCGALAGDYVMQPIQAGSMQNSILTGGRISGIGPSGNRIDATILSGTLYNSADPNGLYRGSLSNRVYLQMSIDAVNGQSCGISISTI